MIRDITRREWKALGYWFLLIIIMCAYVMVLNFVGLSGFSPSYNFLSYLARLLGKSDSQFGILSKIMDTFLVRVVCAFVEARYAELYTWIQREFKPSEPVSTAKSGNQTEDVSQYLKWSLNAASTLYMLGSSGYKLYQSVFSIHRIIGIALYMLISNIGGWLIVALTALQKIACDRKEHFRTVSRIAGSQTKTAYNQYKVQDIDTVGIRAEKVNWFSSQAISQALSLEESKNQYANLVELLKGARIFIMVVCGTVAQGLSFESLSPLVDLLIHIGDGSRFISRFRALYPWETWGKLFSADGFGKRVSKKTSSGMGGRLSAFTPSNSQSPMGAATGTVRRADSPETAQGDRQRNFTVMQARRGGGGTEWLIERYKRSNHSKAILKFNDLKGVGWGIALSTWFEGNVPTVGRIRDMVGSQQFKQTCNEIFQGCIGLGNFTIDQTEFPDFYEFFISKYNQHSNAGLGGSSTTDSGSDSWNFTNDSERSFFFFGICIPLLVACKMNKINDLYIDDDPIYKWNELKIAFSGNLSSSSFLEFSLKILSDIDVDNINVTINWSDVIFVPLQEDRFRRSNMPDTVQRQGPAGIRLAIPSSNNLSGLGGASGSPPPSPGSPMFFGGSPNAVLRRRRQSPVLIGPFDQSLSPPPGRPSQAASGNQVDDGQGQGLVAASGSRKNRSSSI